MTQVEVPADQVPEFPLFRPAPPRGAHPPEWAKLRGCLVGRVRMPSGDEAHLVLRHEDVRQLLSNPVYSRMGGDGPAMFRCRRLP